MKSVNKYIPSAVVMLLAGAALWYGPIAQPASYHHFADQKTLAGIAHFADVTSNLGFAVVALWGWWMLSVDSRDSRLAYGRSGYRLFLLGLFITAFGSSWYHLAPDNARLVWDRIPIALACGGLLAGVWGDVKQRSSTVMAVWMAVLAVYSVGWWYMSELMGQGDLRLYLMFQILPMLLIPIWLWIHNAPVMDRWSFCGALLLYAVAKLTENYDNHIAHTLIYLTGHTLKHILATLAAALIVGRLVWRTSKP